MYTYVYVYVQISVWFCRSVLEGQVMVGVVHELVQYVLDDRSQELE